MIFGSCPKMESKIDGMVCGSTVDAGLIRSREKLIQEAVEVERKQSLNKNTVLFFHDFVSNATDFLIYS